MTFYEFLRQFPEPGQHNYTVNRNYQSMKADSLDRYYRCSESISTMESISEIFLITSPPEGVARYCFHPVCLSVCLCVCVCVCVCVRPIFWYFISQLLEEIWIWNLYRKLIGLYSIHWKKLTFIGQRSRSQGRYIDFWRYSHITKTEP